MWELYEAVCKHALGWIIPPPPPSSQTCLLRDRLLFPWDIRELTEVLPPFLALVEFCYQFILAAPGITELSLYPRAIDPWSWKGSSL